MRLNWMSACLVRRTRACASRAPAQPGKSRAAHRNQKLRDEIARLKESAATDPPFRPSGMEKASKAGAAKQLGGKRRGRGTKRDQSKVTREVIVKVDVPAVHGSRVMKQFWCARSSCQARWCATFANAGSHPLARQLLQPCQAVLPGALGLGFGGFVWLCTHRAK